MPCYHFNLSDGFTDIDVEGYELADLAAARTAAVLFLGRLLIDGPESFWNDGQWVLNVTDDAALTLFTLRVLATDAPALQLGGSPAPVQPA